MNNRYLGKITNIPGSMLRDQYGIIGELLSMKLASLKSNLVELNKGRNLCAMGLNLNSPLNIYPSFAGPFADLPLGPHRQEYTGYVPPVYYVSKYM